MQIAFIGQKGIPMKFGGIEKHVERLAVGLAERGRDVFVYTRPWYTSPSRKKFNGVNLISLPSIHTKHLDAISHTLLASLDVLRRDYDIVHYHGVGPALLAWIPRLFRPRTKVIITFHSIDRKHQKWGWFARLALYLGEWAAVKFAHETIAVSKVLQMYCKKEYNADVVYIPNGVEIPSRAAADEIKTKFGLQKGKYFLFLSRLVRHKGAQYLIDAFNQIKTDKKLVIAGAGAFSDKYVKELKEKAKHNPNIIFTGNVSGGSRLWRELFSNAYLFVHPSESEGLPIVVLEAMSFGLPVLASDIPENMEVLSGGYGFSFENKKVKDLKEKMEIILRRPVLSQRAGRAAQLHVRRFYDWKGIVKSVEKIYRDAVGEKALNRAVQKNAPAQS
ncbi:glycosyltransferase family 4 protein [Patescibacteria group bacterium]|nr:glycosyltransferase family 4 protein [Patescibacteria group bacterium]